MANFSTQHTDFDAAMLDVPEFVPSETDSSPAALNDHGYLEFSQSLNFADQVEDFVSNLPEMFSWQSDALKPDALQIHNLDVQGPSQNQSDKAPDRHRGHITDKTITDALRKWIGTSCYPAYDALFCQETLDNWILLCGMPLLLILKALHLKLI